MWIENRFVNIHLNLLGTDTNLLKILLDMNLLKILLDESHIYYIIEFEFKIPYFEFM